MRRTEGNLKGEWKGYRSSRLGKQWRVIYQGLLCHAKESVKRGFPDKDDVNIVVMKDNIPAFLGDYDTAFYLEDARTAYFQEVAKVFDLKPPTNMPNQINFYPNGNDECNNLRDSFVASCPDDTTKYCFGWDPKLKPRKQGKAAPY